MRIDAYSAITQVYQTAGVKKTTQAAKTGSFQDTFQISSAAKDYQTARVAVSQAPDVRMDKVNEIKAMMQNGTYSVSNEAIADKLLAQSKTLTF